MSRYQELHNQVREWKGSSNQQERRNILKNERRERRTRTFDLFRGDLAAHEPEALKPVPKFNFRDTISTLVREKRIKVVAKPRPFLVGTVKHKIHSPPFLHEAFRFNEPKKKCTPVQFQSFAPRNYKFKTPVGLNMIFTTPSTEDNALISPFTLDTVWNKVDNKNVRENLMPNITIRSHRKKYNASNFSPKISLNLDKETAKRELWPEVAEKPVFGRLNLQSLSQPKEIEQEANGSSKIDHSMNSDSRIFTNEEECEKLQNENLDLVVPNNKSNLLNMAVEAINETDTNNSETCDNYESQLPNLTLPVNFRVSEISPPKAILSNTILNCDSLSTEMKGLKSNPTSLNLTFIKTLGFIEEHEENEEDEETIAVNPKNVNKEANRASNINSSSVLLINSSNVIKPNVELGNEAEQNIISFDPQKSKNTSLEVEDRSSDKEIPSLPESILQDNCTDQTVNEIHVKVVSPKKSLETVIINTTPGFVLNQTNFDKEENLNNVSDIPIESGTKINIEHGSSKNVHDQSQVQESQLKTATANRSLRSSLAVTQDEPTYLNHTKTSIQDNDTGDCDPDSLSSINISNCTINEGNSVNIDADTDINQSQAKTSKEYICLNSTSRSSLALDKEEPTEVNHTKTGVEHDKGSCESFNLSKVSNSSRRITEDKCTFLDDEIDNARSQAKKSLQFANLTSNNDVIPSENHAKSVTECNSTEISLSNLPSVESSNRRITEDKNINVGVYSCSTKLIDRSETTESFEISDSPPQINIPTSSQLEEKDDLSGKTLMNSNENLQRSQTPQRVSLVPNIKINITSPDGLKKPIVQLAIDSEGKHSVSVKAPVLSSQEIVIDLTASPEGKSCRKSMKVDLRKSVMDYKSPLSSLSNRNPKPFAASSDENDVIDLVSDDEEDSTSLINRIIKQYASSSMSPKQSPRSRTPLASIGNLPRVSLSSSRTPQSPLVNQVKSPAKKTPNLISNNIAIHMSSPVTPLTAHDTPRRTPRSRKPLKDILIEAVEVGSPVRVMTLRNRNISVSPSPSKRTPRAITPRKTPSKLILTKEIVSEGSNDRNVPLKNFMVKEVAANVIENRATPVQHVVVKEVATDVIEDTNHLRVMNLRSRKVNVSPSPQKTPRRRKKECA